MVIQKTVILNKKFKKKRILEFCWMVFGKWPFGGGMGGVRDLLRKGLGGINH